MKTMSLKYFLLSLFLFWGIVSYCQEYRFHNLTMSDGLSHSEIQCISQDQYGFMWIGTVYGLNIYDGVGFTHYFYDANDVKSIPGNVITAITFENDSVWIGTRSGLCLMDAISKKSTRIDIGDNTNVRTLLLDEETQTLWIGTNSGLLKYNTKTGIFQEFNTSNSNISNDIVRALYKDNDGNIWVGTFDKLNRLSQNSNVFKVVDLKGDYRPTIKNNLTMSINSGNANNDSLLWIGTGTGLVLFNRLTNSTQFFRVENSQLPNSVVKAISRSKSGEVWVGTDFGLAEINESYETKVFHHDPFNNNSLVNSIIWTIYEDNSGAIWFGTNNGLSILSKSSKRFQFFPMSFTRGNNIAGYEIRDLIVDSNDNYWLATQFGVVIYNPEKQIFETFNSEQPLARRLTINGTSGVIEDKQGRIWFATSGGIVIWDRIRNRLNRFTASFNSSRGLRTNYIFDFLMLKDGTILINTEEGLHKMIEDRNGISFEYIGDDTILAKGEKYLWSISNSGLVRIDPITFERKNVLNLANLKVDFRLQNPLLEYNNTIWLGIENGLIRYDINSGEYELYEINSNKLFSIINILADDEGNIWATSYNAIIRFSVANKEFDIFPSGHDIQINRFIQKSAYKCENGDLIFGGHDGFIRFSPQNINKSDFIPSVKIIKLFISNKEIGSQQIYNGRVILNQPITVTENIELSYNERSFTLEFSSLQFGNRNGIRYAYKLEGFDLDWNYLNEEKGIANFSNLSPGDYVFRLKGSNNDGVWNKNETTLNIKILPPVWASPIFILLYAVLLVLIIVALIFYFSFRTKMKNELKLVRLEKEYSEKLARTRQQFFTNISHEFRAPLSLIIGPAEKLAHDSQIDEKRKKFVQIIENNARRLLWLSNQLRDFRLLEDKSLTLQVSEFGFIQFARKIYSLFIDKAERKQIDYTFSTDIEQLKVKMDLRKIETILFNLLSNAFKFTPKGGEISVRISKYSENTESGICISIKDSGIGIAKDDQTKIFERFYQTKESIKMQRGSGIGLALVNEYVQFHQGKIELTSQPGGGSEFEIFLPLDVIYEKDEQKFEDSEQKEQLLKPETKEFSGMHINTFVSGNPLILLVEDDVEIADFIKGSLSDKYNVQHAFNGKDALSMISKQLPDIIVSDIIMPEMNGIELTKKIKQNPKTSYIPLILLTGQAETDMQMEGLKSGADAYIIKPFNIDLLEVRINNFLKGRLQLAEFLKHDILTNPKEVQLASQDEKLLKRVVSCIEKHIADPDLNIEKVCDETGMSHSILYRKIKNLTGKTVNEFIRTVRIRRAEQLLRTNKITVSEVMYEIGFTNHSYFAKSFRKVYKMSPKEYKEQFK